MSHPVTTLPPWAICSLLIPLLERAPPQARYKVLKFKTSKITKKSKDGTLFINKRIFVLLLIKNETK